MNYGYSELPQMVGDASTAVRAGFLRKVYGIFFVSLLVTLGAGMMSYQQGIAQLLMGLWLPMSLVGLVSIIALRFARRVPVLNVALFGIYTVIQGGLLGSLLYYLENTVTATGARPYQGIGIEAISFTFVIFLGLTLWVMFAKRDFSFMGGFLFIAILGLLVMGVLNIFIHSEILNSIYCYAGVLIFGGYVLYDTSIIMNRLGPNDSMIGAIELYVDFIGMLWFILRILMRRR